VWELNNYFHSSCSKLVIENMLSTGTDNSCMIDACERSTDDNVKNFIVYPVAVLVLAFALHSA